MRYFDIKLYATVEEVVSVGAKDEDEAFTHLGCVHAEEFINDVEQKKVAA